MAHGSRFPFAGMGGGGLVSKSVSNHMLSNLHSAQSDLSLTETRNYR